MSEILLLLFAIVRADVSSGHGLETNFRSLDLFVRIIVVYG